RRERQGDLQDRNRKESRAHARRCRPPYLALRYDQVEKRQAPRGHPARGESKLSSDADRSGWRVVRLAQSHVRDRVQHEQHRSGRRPAQLEGPPRSEIRPEDRLYVAEPERMPQYTVKMLVDLYGWDYYKQLAKLRPHMVESDGNAINMVISGEVPIAGTIAAYNALNASYKGQPVGIVFPTEGVPVAIAPVAVLQNAPHANAAAVFYRCLASKAVGVLLSKGGLVSGRSDIDPPRGQPKLEELKPYFADLGWLAKNERRMAEQFDDIMAR